MNTRYGYIVRVNSVVRHHCNILCFIEEKNRMIRLKKNNNNKIDKEKKKKSNLQHCFVFFTRSVELSLLTR